eukprot:7158764-Alexandrium_andersonii.AAC.1
MARRFLGLPLRAWAEVCAGRAWAWAVCWPFLAVARRSTAWPFLRRGPSPAKALWPTSEVMGGLVRPAVCSSFFPISAWAVFFARATLVGPWAR